MAKAETEGHYHEVTTTKVDGKQQVVLVKGCVRCEEIRKAREKTEEEARKAREKEEKEAAKKAVEDLKNLNTLIERRQALADEHAKLGRLKPGQSDITPADRHRRENLGKRMDSIDAEMGKLTGSKHDWRREAPPNQ